MSLPNDSTPCEGSTQRRRRRNNLSPLDPASTAEATREAEEIIGRLYSAANSMSCDDADCPGAELFNEPLDADSLTYKNALLLILLGIVDNIGECLDLIRTLAMSGSDARTPDCLNQPASSWDRVSSGTESHPRRGRTTVRTQGPIREPPIPGLYHAQWAPSPAVSPPAHATFCHGWPRSFPPAPAPSLASRSSEATLSNGGIPGPDKPDGAGCVDQEEHQTRAENLTGPFLPTLRIPRLPESSPYRRRSPACDNDNDHHSRGRFAARVDSDSEDREGA